MEDLRQNANEDVRLIELRDWVAQLNVAAEAYYGGRGERMTDFEWDALFDKVKAREAELGVVLPDSPTNRVSADDLAGQKEPHEYAALSLAKTKSVAEVAKWAEMRPIWLSWKLDGLTLVVTYENGRLAKIVTRGDGHVGTNITHLADGIRGIPKTVRADGHLVVRGEAVISYADFEAFLASSEEDYANPRNLASGSLTLKDVEELKRRNLTWIPFTLVHADREIVSWGERMDFLDSIGLRSVERERLDAPTAEAIQAAIDRWTEKVTARENPYPVDGLVVTYDDTAYAATGSVTGHHATRAGFAFKWADEAAATKLDHIEWSCAVASICPVAVFEPVALEGTTVKRASLCNVSECERLGIGGKGTGLSVIKSNKIIPKVVAVTARVGELEIPGTCPVCGAPTAVRVSETGTKTLTCTNADCPARQLAKYERFVSKDGMDIDGLAGETIAKFVRLGWIRSVADIYRLGAHHAEIAALEGFGLKSADNIRDSIEAARTRDPVHFLVALSIPLLGPDVAKRLLGAFPLAELLGKDEATLAAIDGIGPGKSAAFVLWCREPRNRALVDELLREVTLSDYAAPKGGACAGLTFVVTGDVRTYANRNELKAYIESQGGKVAGSVSAKTSFLINNDVTSTSSKNTKARALGIPILSEGDFRSRFASALLLLLSLFFSGCFSLTETPLPSVAIVPPPAQAAKTLAVRGFDATVSECVTVTGVQTVYVDGWWDGGWWGPGYWTTVPVSATMVRPRATDFFRERARELFEDRGWSVMAQTPDAVVEVKFSGPTEPSNAFWKRTLRVVGTLFLSDRAVCTWHARLRIYDNGTGRLLMSRDLDETDDESMFTVVPILGLMAYDRTDCERMRMRCLTALTDRATAEASAFLAR